MILLTNVYTVRVYVCVLDFGYIYVCTVRIQIVRLEWWTFVRTRLMRVNASVVDMGSWAHTCWFPSKWNWARTQSKNDSLLYLLSSHFWIGFCLLYWIVFIFTVYLVFISIWQLEYCVTSALWCVKFHSLFYRFIRTELERRRCGNCRFRSR